MKKILYRYPPPGRQRGVALVVALVLIVGLTMTAVLSMRVTMLDLQMAKNSVDYNYALNVSDGSRILGARALDNHAFYRSWTDFDLPEGISSLGAELYVTNNTTVDDMAEASRDMEYGIDLNGDSDTTDATDLRAHIYVTRLSRAIASGAGSSLGEGYSGLGRGAAGGGGFLFFEIRSRGFAVNNARAITAAHFRYVIRS